jgi:hypothetical protein
MLSSKVEVERRRNKSGTMQEIYKESWKAVKNRNLEIN